MINSLLGTSAIHDTFLTVGTVNKSCCSVLESAATEQVPWSGRSTCDLHQVLSFPVKIWQSLAHGWPWEPGCKQKKWLAGLELDNGNYLRNKLRTRYSMVQNNIVNLRLHFHGSAVVSALVVVLQDGGQQPRHEFLISCLKVMFLLNQVLFSPKIVILMDRATKEKHFVTI